MSRADRKGPHRANYERNRKRILATQNTCGICGHPVDLGLKVPHPMSATIDHIIPVAKNGHPSDISNLQLAHWTCNRQKSDKIFKEGHETQQQVIGNRNLPQSLDWKNYSSKGQAPKVIDKSVEKPIDRPKEKRTVIKIKRKKK